MGGPSPRIWSIEGGTAGSFDNSNSNNIFRCSEVLVVTGHGAHVDRVRFHPSEANQLCTSALDGTVRVWDIRSGAERAVGRIDISSGDSAVFLDWCAGTSSHLAVTERDGSIHIYDARKLSSGANHNRGGGGRQSSGSKSTPLHTFQIPDTDVDACIFSPSGNHLVAATAVRGNTMSDLRIWNWKDGEEAFAKSLAERTQFKVPAHTGPIFSMQFSPDGKRLATGSADAIVGIWDVSTMCCASTITRRLKFIRGVSFSHDSRWLANSSEEDGIDIADASTGDSLGTFQLRERPRDGGPTGGADEIAFNPTNAHILACARAAVGHYPPSANSAVVVAKIKITT